MGLGQPSSQKSNHSPPLSHHSAEAHQQEWEGERGSHWLSRGSASMEPQGPVGGSWTLRASQPHSLLTAAALLHI